VSVKLVEQGLVVAPTSVLATVGAVFVLGTAGVGGVWVMRRRSMVSVRNVYVVGVAAIAGCVGLVAAGCWTGLLVFAPAAAAPVAGALVGRRWRLADLGAGEELRQHELARRWLWQPRAPCVAGDRTYIRSQGEIVRERPWPDHEPFVSMTARLDGARLPRRLGRHISFFGATGSGKTTSALRVAAARGLADHSAVIFIDQKVDRPAEAVLRQLAARAGRRFILIDPEDPDTDRWQPLWGAPADVVARAVEAIAQGSERYYPDMLRYHVGLVAEVLYASGAWPPAFSLLVDACQLQQFAAVLALARSLGEEHGELLESCEAHLDLVESREGREALRGGLVRLALVMGVAWRAVLTPRRTPAGETVGVGFEHAIHAGDIVLLRTYVDKMKDEATAITLLALADLHSAAGIAGAQWTLLLDEFGSVVHMAADRALAMLQRGRTHHGQVLVVTQSAADIEALTQQTGLLASLSDNFSGFVAHRQTAPETRDWLAKLMGTTAIWQSTDQTVAHGTGSSGRGSRRRVREFRVGSDVFAELRDGEAIISTTLGPPPQRVRIHAVQFRADDPARIGAGERQPCEMLVHPARKLRDLEHPSVASAAETAAPKREKSRRAESKPSASENAEPPTSTVLVAEQTTFEFEREIDGI
jgi:hypothetical protein